MSFPPELPDNPPGPEPAARTVPWRGWEALLLYVIALFISAPLTFLGTLGLSKNASIGFAAAATEIVMFLTVVLWVRTRHGLGIAALGFRSDDVKGDILAGVGAGILGLALQIVLLPPVLFVAREITNKKIETPKQLPLVAPGWLLIVLIGITVTIVAPIAEETFFRGFLFQSLRNWMGSTAAAAYSAGIFAIAHISPLLYVPIGALGFVLAKTMERRNSLLAGIVGHAVFNMFGFVVIVSSLK